MDVAAASYGGVLSFKGSQHDSLPKSDARPWPKGLRWQVVGTGLAASTAHFLGALRGWKEEKPEIKVLMRRMREVSNAVAESDSGDWSSGLTRGASYSRNSEEIGAPIMSGRVIFGISPWSMAWATSHRARRWGRWLLYHPGWRSLDDVGTLIKRRNIHMLPLSPDVMAFGLRSQTFRGSRLHTRLGYTIGE